MAEGKEGVILTAVAWGIFSGVYFHTMRKNPWKGFDCVGRCFPQEELERRMAGERFAEVSKYISASQNWLCFRGQYVPKNFVVGVYAVASMDQSDTLHLALITGDTCHGFVYEKDTIGQMEKLCALLPHADVLCSGSLFTHWWSENRERLARQTNQWIQAKKDFGALVDHWHNVTGWTPRPCSGVDDSEAYFRDYPEERPEGRGRQK